MLCEAPAGLLLSQIRYFCNKYPNIFGSYEKVAQFINAYSCVENSHILANEQINFEEKVTFLMNIRNVENIAEPSKLIKTDSNLSLPISISRQPSFELTRDKLVYVPKEKLTQYIEILDTMEDRPEIHRSEFICMMVGFNSMEAQRLLMSIQSL